MTTRTRNEFLDIVTSDDEDNDRGYDSEAAEESKGRTVKRRRTQAGADQRIGSGEEDDESADSEVSDAEVKSSTRQSHIKGSKTKPTVMSDDEDGEKQEHPQETEEEEHRKENDWSDQYLDVEKSTASKRKKPIDTAKISKKKNKTGVIYLSSLPPYLKPFALQSLLETRGFSPITKVFLAPTVRAPSAPRRRSNKRKTYTDGWVEFASKKTAKICAETLNASIVGGPKGGWYHDDVWNMKYLKGFKWADLMEQVQRERSEREAKRRIEDTRARKEDKVFLEGYETGKMLAGIQKKNEEKKKRKMESRDGEGAGREEQVKLRRLFKQNDIKFGRDKIGNEGSLEDETKRVLGKIF